MKRYEVIIEETVAGCFKFEIPDNVDIYEYVRENYYKGKIVLEQGECQYKKMEIHDLSDNSWSDWKEF